MGVSNSSSKTCNVFQAVSFISSLSTTLQRETFLNLLKRLSFLIILLTEVTEYFAPMDRQLNQLFRKAEDTATRNALAALNAFLQKGLKNLQLGETLVFCNEFDN